jgi:hypothetical protein
MVNNTIASAATLVPLYALRGTPLAAHVAVIQRALDRAVRLRASDVQPPGNWTMGMMLPRTDDGRMNFDEDAPIPNLGPRMLWIGGNGGG